jgi:hypothetical protein
MAAPQNTIALIFDFDDTLTDDSTTGLLRQYGVDDADFWTSRFAPLVEDGWDPAPAYLKLLLDLVGDDAPLRRLSNAGLRQFGATLKFYPGLPGLFNDLRNQVKAHTVSNPSVEFYVISGGLEEVILGSSIAKHFIAVRGCRFSHDLRWRRTHGCAVLLAPAKIRRTKFWSVRSG